MAKKNLKKLWDNVKRVLSGSSASSKKTTTKSTSKASGKSKPSSSGKTTSSSSSRNATKRTANAYQNRQRESSLSDRIETKTKSTYTRQNNDDISPLRKLTNTLSDIGPTKKEKDDSEKWFKKGAFEDGYQVGDIMRTLSGTAVDAQINMEKGLLGTVEGITDLELYRQSIVQKALGRDDASNALKVKAQENTIDKMFQKPQSYADKYSILGGRSDSVAQGIGQVSSMILTGGMGEAAGLSTKGVSALNNVVLGASSMGSGMREAYQNGASDKEALAYGSISGAGEVFSEMLFGGIGKTVNAVGLSRGITSIDDAFAQKLSSKINNRVLKNLTEFGVKSSAEGVEEVVSGIVSAVGKKLTYMSDESLKDLIKDEDLLDQFVVGAVTSGITQSGVLPGMGKGSLIETTKEGRDFVSGYSQNEQAVIDKEIENRIKEKEEGGTKLTTKEKGKIKEEVEHDLEKGYISMDTIESTLAGETYKNYKSAEEYETKLQQEYDELHKMKRGDMTGEQIDREATLKNQLDELKANSKKSQLRNQLDQEIKKATENDYRLYETFNERSRRGQAFEADLSKYDAKQQETIKRAVDSGILNNTNRTHEFVDMVAKISADKGVLFDFTNNKKIKETGFAIEGKTVNGYVKDGNIAVNIESSKALNTVVGHEITHVLEGTELYTELQKAVKEYATTKGEYDTRYNELKDLYKDVDSAVIENEITADIIGEYLFTDADFVSNLSTKNPNVFQRIYEEIKYLVKINTGSKESRELAKVQKAFEEAYRNSTKSNVDTDFKYSLKGVENGIEVYETSEDTKELSYAERRKKLLDTMKNEYKGRTAKFTKNGETYYAMYNDRGIKKGVFGDKKSDVKGYKAKVNIGADGNYVELAENSLYTGTSVEQGKNSTFHKTAKTWDYYVKTIKSDGAYFDVLINVKDSGNNQFVYDITMKEATSLPDALKASYDGSSIASKNSISESAEKSSDNVKYSISDSDGKTLTESQQEYFKDSKVRDENGNLKVMYHGSQESFTTFDKKKAKSSGLYGRGFYFTDSKTHAQQYGSQYEVYLNITNPLKGGTNNITKEQLRNFVEAISEDYGIENYGYGSTVDSVAEDVYGKDDFAMIMDLNATCVGDMVEAIELFNDVNGTDYNGIVAPTETVAFYPYQIKKVDNEKPTSNDDIRFSLSKTVEETKDLLAIHNLSADKLSKTLDLGGMPMPSVAITKADTVGHDKFGEISLILKKESIDPKASKYNKVYSGDAYTPTFPMVDYEANSEVSERIYNKVNEHYNELPEYYQRNLRRLRDSDNIEDTLNREGGEQNFIDKQANDYGIKQLYLAEKGEVVPVVTKQTRTEMPELEKETCQYVLDKMGEDAIRASKGQGITGKEWFKQYGDQIKNAYVDLLVEDGNSKETATEYVESRKNVYWVTMARKAAGYLENGGVTIQETDDISETNSLIDEKIDPEEFNQWVNNLFKGVAGNSGIRNKKELFTPSGNRRSFEELHDPVTLNNIVKAMRGEELQTGQGAFGLVNMKGASAKEYKSINDIKSDSNRLGTMTEEQKSNAENYISDTIMNIAQRYANGKDVIDARNTLVEAVANSESKKGISNYLKQFDYVYKTDESIVNDLIGLRDYVRNLPTPYFEAKPRRAVGLDEVGVYVVPNNLDTSLKGRLLEEGYSIAEYDPNVEGDRARVVNQFEQYKFSLSNRDNITAPVGNYNVYGKDIALDKQAAGNVLKNQVNEYAPMMNQAGPRNDSPVEFSSTVNSAAPVRKDVVVPNAKKFTAPMREAGPVKGDSRVQTASKQSAPIKSVTKVKGATTNQQIAQIIDMKPVTEKQKNDRKMAIVAANVLDKGLVFENLSIKTKNRELMGKWDYIMGSEARAQRLIGKGSETYGVKSLNSIMAEVKNTGLEKPFEEYMYHKHNVDRMNLDKRFEGAENKPVFGYNVTSEMSQRIVSNYESRHPEFKRFANDVYAYNRHLRQELVSNGVISQETAYMWEKMYPHYVPIMREDSAGPDINVSLDTRRTGVNAPIKKSTGGSSNFYHLFDTMAMRTRQTYKATAKNSFGVELKNTLNSGSINSNATIDEIIDGIDAQESLLQEGKNGRNPTFTVFENGQRVTFEITEDMYDALKPVSDSSLLSKTFKPLNVASNLHRSVLTEYNPVFLLTNAIKDAQDVLINSQHAAKTYLKIPEAHVQMLSKGYWYNEYMENGGEQNTYFDGKNNTFSSEDEGIKKYVKLPLNAISTANNYIEMIPRLAEYIASREAGRSIEVSMLDAARVTTNFKAGGDLTKFINRNGGTFLNASVQGAMQQVRNVREANMNGIKGWAALATKFAVAGAPAFLLNGLLWDDDDEYEELSEYVKQNYYVVAKYDNGKFIRIPKGRTVAVIQEAIRQVQELSTGDDEADMQTYLNAFVDFLGFAGSNLAPNNPIDNNVLAPIMQVINNETWYGEDLVPSRLQDVPKKEQYDESTDSISRFIGDKLNVSPIKVNYLLNQYSGGVGDVVLPMLTPEAESGDDTLIGNLLAPLKDKFTTDSVLNNRNISDFYELSDELKVNANSSEATEDDILRNEYMSAVSSDLGELYNKKREIQNSSDMTNKQKYEEVREIQKRIDEIAEEALDEMKYYNADISGRYAMVGSKQFLKNEDGEWRNISEERIEKQEEASRLLGITAKEYWDNDDDKYVYDWAVKNQDYYQVSRAISDDVLTYWKHNSYMWNDIRADKDENGKSISGSKKRKIIDYINGISDLSYEGKLVLYKKYYPSDDTYNYEIIEYLNSRSDISYEEMETILKELEFEVDSQGNISW